MEERNNSFMSEVISEITMALSEFQGSIEQPKLEKEVSVRTKAGSSYKFKYADLSACVKSAAPRLKEYGLAVTQLVANGKLITLLSHKSGQWFKSEVLLPAQSADYQAFGSAITYLKRYSYCAILGIVADNDDDANLACGNEAQVRQSYTPAQLQQALAEIKAVTNEKALYDVWNKWSTACPAITANTTEFYKAVCDKKSFNTSVKK